MPDLKFELTPEEIVIELQKQLAKMRAETDRNQLSDLTPDEAFERGYEVAIFDLKMLLGPDPRTANKETSA